MNILLQIAGFFIMLTIFIFYFIDRKAEVRSNRQFLYFGIAIFISLILDVTSLIFIDYLYNPDLYNIPTIITKVVCKLYCYSCVVVTYFSLLYVLMDVFYDSKKKYRITGLIALTVNLVGFVLMMVLPIEVYQDKTGYNDYTAGYPVTLTYIFTFFNMLLTVGFIVAKRKKMYKKRVLGVIIYLSIWAFGALVQAIENYLSNNNFILLTVGFSEAIGAMVVYILLENPALNIDKVTGALNKRAFSEYLDYCYEAKVATQFIIIDYDTTVTTSIMGYDSFARLLNKYLIRFKVKKIFKTDKNKFVAIRYKKNYDKNIEEAISNFKDVFYKENNIHSRIPVRILFISNIFLFHNTTDIMSAIDYIYEQRRYANEDFINVTSDVVSRLHEKFLVDEKCDIAFANKRLEVYYQPIFSRRDGSFTAAEALVRLVDEDKNLIPPVNFIEEMERDGRIVELGQLVFEEVCRFMSEHDINDLGLDYIEVNLSAIQCGQDNLADVYIGIMEKYKINPKYINLEITETGDAVKNTLLKNMERLKEYGVSFSLDDFGTGHSNLNYIVEMPVEIVKFDKTMVTKFFENKIATYVMSSTVNMIKQLGHKIVFEGLEDINQIRAIEDLDVDYIQGYYYSKPLEKEKFKEFLIDNNK